jgi:hypothetical protein
VGFPHQIEGGQKHPAGLQIDTTGTQGVLRVTNPRAFKKTKRNNSIEGVNSDGASLSPLPVPAAYRSLAASHLDASVQDMAYLYAAYACDRKNGTSEASNFRDALRQHQLIDQIVRTSETFSNRDMGDRPGSSLKSGVMQGPCATRQLRAILFSGATCVGVPFKRSI